MISRFNYKPLKKRDSSHDDEFSKFSYEKELEVISYKEDKRTIDKYREKTFWKKEKNSWSEFIKSYDLGSVQDQVMNHLTKGTPLVTAHVLPPADYTKLEKGAEIKREMIEKGISLEMVVSAIKDALQQKEQPKEEKVEQQVAVEGAK